MEQAPIAAGPIEASVRELPPQHPGQARTMLICETERTVSAEVGHWYSPDKVAELLAKELEACIATCEAAEDTGNDIGIERDVAVWNKAVAYCVRRLKERSKTLT